MANDSFTILNAGHDGDCMDESENVYGTGPNSLRKKPRVVLTSDGKDIVGVVNDVPTGDEFGLVTRSIINYPGSNITSFGTVTNISQDTPTTVTTYTVPSGKVFNFVGVICSGNTNATFTVAVDDVVGFAGRSTIACINWHLINPVPLFQCSEGQTLSLTVEHQTNAFCDFDGTLLGYLTP